MPEPLHGLFVFFSSMFSVSCRERGKKKHPDILRNLFRTLCSCSSVDEGASFPLCDTVWTGNR